MSNIYLAQCLHEIKTLKEALVFLIMCGCVCVFKEGMKGDSSK